MGYPDHLESETESDGDGGVNSKLSGLGHIKFSQKGIPHGSLHFPTQLLWAGHIFMHDTCAPEAAHKTNIKRTMDRVQKLDDTRTSASMIEWWLRVRTWRKIIKNEVQRECNDGSLPKEEEEDTDDSRGDLHKPSSKLHL